MVGTEREGKGDKKPLCRVTPSRWPEVGRASHRLTLTKPTEELSHPAPPQRYPIAMRLSEAPGVSACGPLIHCDMEKKSCGNSVTIGMGGIGPEPHRSMAWAEHVPEAADEIRKWNSRQTSWQNSVIKSPKINPRTKNGITECKKLT